VADAIEQHPDRQRRGWMLWCDHGEWLEKKMIMPAPAKFCEKSPPICRRVDGFSEEGAKCLESFFFFFSFDGFTLCWMNEQEICDVPRFGIFRVKPGMRGLRGRPGTVGNTHKYQTRGIRPDRKRPAMELRIPCGIS